MSTISSNATFNNAVFNHAEAFKLKAALLTPAVPAADKPKEEASALPNKLLDGLNQLAYANRLVIQMQATQVAKTQAKEVKPEQAKSLIAPVLKKEEKFAAHERFGKTSNPEKTGLFEGLPFFTPIKSNEEKQHPEEDAAA